MMQQNVPRLVKCISGKWYWTVCFLICCNRSTYMFVSVLDIQFRSDRGCHGETKKVTGTVGHSTARDNGHESQGDDWYSTIVNVSGSVVAQPAQPPPHQLTGRWWWGGWRRVGGTRSLGLSDFGSPGEWDTTVAAVDPAWMQLQPGTATCHGGGARHEQGGGEPERAREGEAAEVGAEAGGERGEDWGDGCV